MIPDATGTKAAAITWTKTPVEGSMLTHPGVYCLRSNETTWDAETPPPPAFAGTSFAGAGL